MNDIKQTAMITIVGRPNVGKSTLTNALVGEKIAIVSSKPQTTRNRICGVFNQGDTQFVFLDTPGFHRARTRLGDYMVKVVRESVADVDGVCLLVEPIAKVGPPEQALIDRIREEKLPAVLVINKIDTVEKAQLLEVLEAMAEAGYKPTGKEFVLVPGENDDIWEQDKKPAPYREMRCYIWDNHVASCDDFIEYCKRERPEWAEFLEDPVVRRTAEGFVNFTVLRQGLNKT